MGSGVGRRRGGGGSGGEGKGGRGGEEKGGKGKKGAGGDGKGGRGMEIEERRKERSRTRNVGEMRLKKKQRKKDR